MGARSSVLTTFGDRLSWSVLDAAPDGVIIVDAAGAIVFANDQMAALIGTSADNLLGRPVEELLPDDLRAAHVDQRSRYQQAPTIRPMGAGLLLRARRLVSFGEMKEDAREIAAAVVGGDRRR